MRWISNHDTVSWTFQKQRPAKAYGLARTRALLSLFALVPGVPMLYQGDEDPSVYRQSGASGVSYLSRIYALRESIPAIRNGAVDYVNVSATKGVFACLRSTSNQTALILISFNANQVKSKVTVPDSVPLFVRDVLSSESLELRSRSFDITLEPYQTRVLVTK